MKKTITFQNNMPEDDGSGFIVLTRRQLRNTKIGSVVIITILIIGFMYLYSHMILITGALKEREGKQCVDAAAMRQWEETLDMTRAICVDAPNAQLGEMKELYNMFMGNCKNEVEHWKNSYWWYKKQVEETNSIIK